MRYHNITHDDMLNGNGLRVVLWVAGCEHHCDECHNPITWDIDGGIKFSEEDKQELMTYLGKDYTAGVTFSGGDPLHPANRSEVERLIIEAKTAYPNKDIWIYTGYQWDEVKDLDLMKLVDVLVDGEYKKELHKPGLHWCGSVNQKIIDVPKSLELDTIVLWKESA